MPSPRFSDNGKASFQSANSQICEQGRLYFFLHDWKIRFASWRTQKKTSILRSMSKITRFFVLRICRVQCLCFHKTRTRGFTANKRNRKNRTLRDNLTVYALDQYLHRKRTHLAYRLRDRADLTISGNVNTVKPNDRDTAQKCRLRLHHSMCS